MIEVLNRSVKSILPPKRIKPSEWVEEYLKFSDGELMGSPMRLYEFQKQPLNDIIDPKVRKIVLMSSAQLLKTTIITSASMYFIANDPSNIVIAGATGNTIKKYRNGKFDPTINLCPQVSQYITSKSDKTKTNDQFTQETTHGTFNYFVSLGAPSTLRGLTAKRVLCDEISGVEDSDEGNPISLVEQRCESFRDSLIMMCSTPLVNGDPITQEWEKSNKSKFHVTCVHCKHEHVLEWENVKFKFKSVDNGRRSIPDSETSYLECPKCKHVITESERVRMVEKGRWIATNPDVKDVHGYHINRLYSPVSSIRKMVQDYAEAFKSFDLMRFYNNSLGLPYVDREAIETDLAVLEQLRDFDISIENIPDDTVGLCFGIDQQQDRLEVTTLGISEKNLYVLDHRSFYSVDCTKLSAPAYSELSAFITKSNFKTRDGKPLRVLQAWIDSSNGNATNTVYRFCNLQGNNVFKPIKGGNNHAAELFKSSRSQGYEFMLLNVNDGKNKFRKLLNAAIDNDPENEAQKIHFSYTLPDDAFLQYTSEKRALKGGQMVWIKTGSERNEMLDCINYALIATDYQINKLGAQAYSKLRKYINNQAKVLQDNHQQHEKPSSTSATNTNSIKPTTTTKTKPTKNRNNKFGTNNWFNK